ncbi:hypothetical protein F3Q19_17035 [Salmonella enterica subsp. enterica]|nr:hypothetical protein [Salmonella enterica subsp. enterica]ECW0789062.1 hypothetical protein [Salmonella enterica subsp. enterica]
MCRRGLPEEAIRVWGQMCQAQWRVWANSQLYAAMAGE